MRRKSLVASLKLVYTDGVDTSSYSTWLEIDTSAVRSNVRQLMAISERPLMAVVKANSYGHGLVGVARAAVEGGARWCAVARIEEALELRQGGLTCGILVLGYTTPEQVPVAVREHISLNLYSREVLDALAAQVPQGQRLRVHVKVDSGMGRLGFYPKDVPAVMRELCADARFEVEGMFTHFARSDEPEVDATHKQLARFIPALEALQAEGTRPPLVHASNSAAILYYPEARFDMVRSGIAVIGMDPSPEAPLPAEGFTRALTWKARLISVRTFPPGTPVSYGTGYTTRGLERIGVLPVGYADGFQRQKPNIVLVRGQVAPVIGRVCMDQCMVQLDGIPEAHVGDEVVLLGQQGSQRITPEEAAERWGTNNYDVVCSLAARLPRLFI